MDDSLHVDLQTPAHSSAVGGPGAVQGQSSTDRLGWGVREDNSRDWKASESADRAERGETQPKQQKVDPYAEARKALLSDQIDRDTPADRDAPVARIGVGRTRSR